MTAGLRTAGLLAAVVAALAAFTWGLAPGPAQLAVVVPEAEPWPLSGAGGPPTPATVERIAAANLWGAMAQSGSAAPGDAPWRFMGIVKSGAERFVLIKVEGMPESRLTLKDRLPGGSEIVDIGEDTLCIVINGQRRRLAIYSSGAQVL